MPDWVSAAYLSVQLLSVSETFIVESISVIEAAQMVDPQHAPVLCLLFLGVFMSRRPLFFCGGYWWRLRAPVSAERGGPGAISVSPLTDETRAQLQTTSCQFSTADVLQETRHIHQEGLDLKLNQPKLLVWLISPNEDIYTQRRWTRTSRSRSRQD